MIEVSSQLLQWWGVLNIVSLNELMNNCVRDSERMNNKIDLSRTRFPRGHLCFSLLLGKSEIRLNTVCYI